MASNSRVRLLEVDPDVGRLLSVEEREAASQVTLEVLELGQGEPIAEKLDGGRPLLSLLILEGMLIERLRIREHTVMRVLGPGDYLLSPTAPVSGLLASAGWSAALDTRVALIGGEMLAAVRSWPSLFVGWQERLAAQSERQAVQLAISQLPRVTDRVLGILWMLADLWGRVTPGGVVLPLTLTHEALGALVGARRPTVTLALRELVERGALLRQDRGWLLLESLPEPVPEPGLGDEVVVGVTIEPRSSWSDGPIVTRRDAATASRAELLETVAQMRAELAAGRARVKEQVALARRTRENVLRRRAEVADSQR